MSAKEDFVLSVVTPSGRGAIATVIADGEGALQAVCKSFAPASGETLSAVAQDRIVFGTWQNCDQSTEDLVVCHRSTGTIEIHCHGGRAAIEAISETLCALGGQMRDWRDCVSQTDDGQLEKEAHLALVSARTERVAGILLDQIRGALNNAIDEIILFITNSDHTAAIDKLNELKAASRVGLHLINPWKVVIAGAANVGKSSLINRLLGYERSIVFDAPGTTRDVVSANTAFAGWPVQISDTAGFRAAEQDIEAIGQSLAEHRVASAELVLIVSDLSQPWTSCEEGLLEQATQPILVHNKCDLAPIDAQRPMGLNVSAKTGEGISELVEQLVNRLVPDPPPSPSPVPFLPKHVASIERAIEFLGEDEGPTAIEELKRLL